MTRQGAGHPNVLRHFFLRFGPPLPYPLLGRAVPAVVTALLRLMRHKAVLFPLATRELLLPEYKLGKRSLTYIAELVDLPEFYVAKVMSNGDSMMDCRSIRIGMDTIVHRILHFGWNYDFLYQVLRRFERVDSKMLLVNDVQ